MDGLERLSAKGVVRTGQGVFGRTQEKSQRRAELVADVAEERRLGAVDLRERLRAVARLLEECALLIAVAR
jgi:hypothetical protein